MSKQKEDFAVQIDEHYSLHRPNKYNWTLKYERPYVATSGPREGERVTERTERYYGSVGAALKGYVDLSVDDAAARSVLDLAETLDGISDRLYAFERTNRKAVREQMKAELSESI